MTQRPFRRERDHPAVITLPPVIYLVGLVVGLLLDRFAPLGRWPHLLPPWGRWPVGALLVAAGLALAITAVRTFRRAGTSFRVDRPATALVTDGLYARSRNPIYVGLTLAYLGLAGALASLWSLALVVPTIAVLHWGVILPEERYLEEKFGGHYRRYCRRVRRWI